MCASGLGNGSYSKTFYGFYPSGSPNISKSVWEQSHVGSNPTRCATSEQAMYRLLRLFLKVRARSRRCSSFPNRNRLRWVAIWVRRCAAFFSYRKEISILTAPSTSEQSPLCSDVFLCMRQKRRHLPAPLLLLSNCDPLRWARSWCAALRATSQYQRLLTNPPAVQEEKFTILQKELHSILGNSTT